ncbi:MAG: AI-2E family transporter [Verrucomicrobiota bacterium]
MALTLFLVGWLHLATPFLAVLFSLFILNKLHMGHKKWLALTAFIVLVLGIAYAVAHFINEAVVALPAIADRSIPLVLAWAQEHGIELPFTDYESLKAVSVDTVKQQARYLRNVANLAKGATTQFAFLVIGIVVAVSLFLNSKLDLDRGSHALKDNLYSACCDEIAERFHTFFQSFATVMGAQIVISAINTILTTIFLLVVDLPYTIVVVGVTFLCGLLPVIGNLISNTIIVGIAFTISPKMAFAALTFLVVIHKLEYFLNSKIIGDRIRNPVWLTLLGLIIGERLMGIPGMILAPVVLNYLKVESARIRVETPAARDLSAP